jgi:hypothetical protein
MEAHMIVIILSSAKQALRSQGGAENRRAKTLRRSGVLKRRHERQLTGVAEALLAEGKVLNGRAV